MTTRILYQGYLCVLILTLMACFGVNNHVPAHHEVQIKGMKFVPDDLVVQTGDTVTWVNNDIVAHDVTDDPGKAWSSSAIQNGESWSRVIEGDVDYYCSLHVVMKGKIRVE